MKKSIILLVVTLIIIFSCSKTDDAIAQDSSILPKRVINVTQYSNAESLISYNGNKIFEVNAINFNNNQNTKTIFTYNGDLIAKTERFRNNLIDSSNDFTYENNKLKSVLHIDYGLNQSAVYKYRIAYSYNQNGTILVENYIINIQTGAETKNDNSTIYTFDNGNLKKKVDNSSYSNFNGNNNTVVYNRYTSIYEYDNKSNPFKNIVGLGKINLDILSVNNIIKSTNFYETSTDKIIYSTPSPQIVTNYILLYAANNFLKESKYDEIKTGGSGLPETFTNTSQFFYE